MVEETLEAKLKRHEDALVACMAEIERLRAENVALKVNNASAHQTLRAIYADSSQPATVRVRAAQAALNVETPSLKPEPAPLDLVAKEAEYEPLSVVVERQRARMNRILALPLEERERMIAGVGRDDGNGQDDDTAAS
jgi:hypothetical protein